MKQEVIIKKVVRVGNSAGVVLPKSWYGGEARIELVSKPLNIKSDVLRILGPYLDKVLGIYLVGSYARSEHTGESDIDVLVITSGLDKNISSGKYEIIMVSKENVEDSLENNVLPILPMLKESEALLNADLIRDYTKISLTKKNLKFHFETTKSAVAFVEEAVNLYDEAKEKVPDGIIYSLVLRLREIYIVDCLMKNKSFSNKELLFLIKKLVGGNAGEIYETYIRSKKGLKSRKEISVSDARKIHRYILKEMKRQEKWIRKKG